MRPTVNLLLFLYLSPSSPTNNSLSFESHYPSYFKQSPFFFFVPKHSPFESKKSRTSFSLSTHFSHFMEVLHNQTVASSSPQTPLIILDSQQQEELNDTPLNRSLHRLETLLRIFGFCQYSVLSFTLSWVSFLLLGVALPLLAIELSPCSDCEKYEIKSFELEILVSQSLVAAISLLCISRNLRKYGLRKFLFVDRYHGHMAQYREEYLQKINVSNPNLLFFFFLLISNLIFLGF